MPRWFFPSRDHLNDKGRHRRTLPELCTHIGTKPGVLHSHIKLLGSCIEIQMGIMNAIVLKMDEPALEP
jgi:hypothetical protein